MSRTNLSGATRARSRMVRWTTAGAAGVMLVALASACGSSSPSSSSSQAPAKTGGTSLTGFPRSETLYTSGSAYTPPTTWNPFAIGSMATGTQGLVYEPLFLYNPIKNSYEPWLASNGTWSGTTYTLTVRSGVKWSNGKPLTGNDVAYSINLARTNASDPFHSNVSTVSGATASGNTVTVKFSGTPGYAQFQDYLWKAPVVNQAIWSKIPASQILTYANKTPVGTGPMLLDTYNQTEVAYKDNSSWWAKSALNLNFKFKYLVDVVNGSNNVELSALTAGQIDWSNNFLPGINELVSGLNGNAGYGFKTYYAKSPYMLSANTVWLEPNTTKAPMNNVNFRKALAYAINPSAITNSVYGNITEKANPTGLLPNLAPYINKSVVSQDGFSYNTTLAKHYLQLSGYHGQNLTLEVPDGWTDWMAGIQLLSQQFKAVGINVTPTFPQDAARNTDLNGGNYDLALDNNASADATPYSYFQRVYNLPIEKQQTAQLNWERFNSPTDWNLVQEAGSTAPTDTSKLDSIYSQLEGDFLKQLPEIPVWYNGAWFQGNSQYWSSYPAAGTSDQNTPVMWYGYLGAMTTVYALADLQPAKPASS